MPVLRRLPTFAPFGEQLIARDEGLHTEFACELYSMLERKLSDAEVHAIVEEAVAIETEFVTSALPSGLIGINAGLMTEYVRYCADRLLVALNAPKRYNAAMPFDWMEMVSNPRPNPVSPNPGPQPYPQPYPFRSVCKGKRAHFDSNMSNHKHPLTIHALRATGTFSKSACRNTPRRT